ncbi:hypothetical protein [Actinomadura pelletieri]|uniref:hypothetical protein n=1 Tax=Actinomadura pelletieri TaxID=111805 RepID=UPI001476AB4D|nr:hypothetical protein [Actinomadura pelletieri]
MADETLSFTLHIMRCGTAGSDDIRHGHAAAVMLLLGGSSAALADGAHFTKWMWGCRQA